MFNKKILLLTIILISLFAISTVNAADNATDDVVSVDEITKGSNMWANDVSDTVGVCNDDKMYSFESSLLSNASYGTFTDLANEIENADGELNLTKNYVFSECDENFKKYGINIKKNIKINGNGFKINGNSLTRAFYIYSYNNPNLNNLILNNILFENCQVNDSNTYGGGAAILCYNDCSIDIFNCNFTNCFSKTSSGSTIYTIYTTYISNCNFINCSSINSPCTIHIEDIGSCCILNSNFVKSHVRFPYRSDLCNITNCSFLNSYDTAIVNGNILNCYFYNCSSKNMEYAVSGSINVKKCIFEQCSGIKVTRDVQDSNFINCSRSAYGGGAIHIISKSNSSVSNCTFTNCSSDGQGGAIYVDSRSNCSVSNCTFTNCLSNVGGGAIYVGSWSNCSVSNCTFINCSSLDDLGAGAIGIDSNCSISNCKFYRGFYCNNRFLIRDDSDNGALISNSAFFNPLNQFSRYSILTRYGIIFNCSFINYLIESIDVISIDGWENAVIYQCDSIDGSKTLLNVCSDEFNIDDKIIIMYNITSLATGILSIYVNDTFIKNVTVGDEIELEDLKAGKYVIKVVYNSDGYFSSCESTANLEISKLSADCYIDKEHINEDTVNITVVFNEDVTGNINFSFGKWDSNKILFDDWIPEQVYQANIINGKVSFMVPNRIGGWHEYVLEYDGDDRYLSFQMIGSLYFEFNDSPISVNIPKITWGDSVILKPILPKAAKGNIVLLIDNVTLANIPVGGNFSYKAVDGGKHNLTIKYSGDGYFIYNETTFEFNVAKLNTTCSITDNIEAGDSLTINVTLNGDATGNMTVLLNNNHYCSTLMNGLYAFSVNIKAGLYNVTIDYGGDSKYNAFNKVETLNVTLKKNSLTLDLKNIIVGNNIVITPRISDGATGYIDIYVDDVFKQSINAGSSYTLTKPNVGKHEVKIRYESDGYFQSCENTSVFWVFSQYPIDTKDTYIIYNSRNYFNAKFYDENHNPLSNKYVVFNVGGKDYARLTDSYGVATLDLDLDIGEYNITSINTIYNENTTNKLVVYTSIQSENLIRAYNSGNDFNATFLDDKAKPLANTYVVFKVDGIDYTVKTNMNGQAVLNVPLAIGTHEIISINTLTNENKINKLDIVPSIHAEDIIRAYNSTMDYMATFTGANSDHLINTPVTFEVGLDKYEVMTDGNGVAILNVPLAVGEYNVTAVNPVTGEKLTKKLNIVERIINNENMVIFTDSETYFRVTVIGDNGEVCGHGETVVFKFNDNTYSIKTDQYGYASLLISSVDNGLYPIHATYKGYTVSNNITVFKNLESVILIDVNDADYLDNVKFNVGVLPQYAHGNLTISITSNNGYLLEFNSTADETFTKELVGLNVSDYVISVKFMDMDNYYTSQDVALFKVLKIDPKIIVVVGDAEFGQNATITVNIPQVTGNVTIAIGDKKNFKDYMPKDGVIIKRINDLNVGEYDVIVTYEGNNNYNKLTKVAKLNVNKIPVNIVVPSVIEEILEINLPSDASGNVIVTINNKNYGSEVKKGNAKIDLSLLYNGDYPYELTYSGDNKYSSFSDSGILKVNKAGGDAPVWNNWNFNVDFSEAVIYEDEPESETWIYVYNLANSANAKLSLFIDDKLVKTQKYSTDYDDSDLSTDISFDASKLSEGIHKWKITYYDEDNHINSTQSGLFKVYKVGSPDKQFLVNKNGTVSQISGGFKFIKNGTLLIDDDEETYAIYSFTADGIEYMAIHWFPVTFYSVECYKVFNPNDYKEYDGIYYKTIDGSISEVIDNYEVIDGVYYADIGRLYDYYSNGYDKHYFVLDGICYKTQFYHHYGAIEGSDYKVIDGKYYTLDGIEIMDESLYYDGFVIVKNGRYYFEGNLYFYHIMSTVGYNYVKLNNEFYRLVQTWNSDYSVEKNYALINGKLYSVVNENIGSAIELDIKEPIKDVVIPDLNEPSANGEVTINLPSDATGIVTLTINKKDYNFAVVNGVANVIIPSLANGEYPYTITYSGDGKYSSFTNTGSLKVNKTGVNPVENQTGGNKDNDSSSNNATKPTPKVVVPPLDKPSSDGSVTVTLPSDATGTVTLTVNGKNYDFDVKNGKANVKLPELANGDYSYTITYSGDSKYSSFTNTGSLKVNKTSVNPVKNTTDTNASGNTTNGNATNTNTPTNNSGNDVNTTKPTSEIVIPPLDRPSSDGSIPVTLPSDATGTVTLTVNGKDYNFDVKNGKANVKLPELANGDYPYTITYSGDSKYSSFVDSGSLKVENTVVVDNRTSENKTDSNATEPTVKPDVVIPPLDKPSSDGSVTVKLPSDATGKVTLTINGKDYSYLVENGVANVIIPNLGDGNYPYTITYSGDSKYSSFTNTGSLKVDKTTVTPVDNQTNTTSQENTTVDNSKIVASNKKVTYATGKYYTIKVYGKDGQLANGVEVVIIVKGKTFKTLTTKDGVAKFKITQKPGTYKMTISALNKNVTKTLTVKHLVTLKSVTVKRSAKKLVLQATLGKVNGKYLKNKKITFKFNGKKYTAKTNKKGVAKVTIKSSILKKLKVGKKVTYQATYLKDTVKKTVKVKK
ncbi:Ig-like domain repeat protein [Methanobrevibacter sp.]|uniref:Ig-like domain repeat protein n=1 Tax=Methanobrevibacter sp. TaxID=66852 RepID=UPI003865EEF7